MNDLNKGLKVGILDIESTGLKADWGYIICASVKEVNRDNLKGKTVTFRVDDYRGDFTDETLVKDLNKHLDGFDLLCTWYGSVFDWRFINARSTHHNIALPAKNYRRDLCFCSRGLFAIGGHSLANVARFMFGKTDKTRTDFDIWLKAMRGDSKATDYLVDHCEKDVLETERVYKRMLPNLGKLRRG